MTRQAAGMVADGKGSEPEAVQTARYIGNMAKELRELAAKADLGFLAYLLSMVEDDAVATLQGLEEDARGD
jgi:hypothetical protein